MKHLAFAVMILFASTAHANVYADNEQTKTHNCSKDPDAAILGNNNTITFTGKCKRIAAAGNENTLRITSVEQLHIAGNDNTATVDAVDEISVPGNDNTVTWKKGLSTKRPKVSVLGNDNRVGAAK